MEFLDYETLRIIWWVLMGVLLIGFAVMDGFDFGVVMLLPFVAKKPEEKNAVVGSVKPFWEGNQVWLILGAGAIFAAWPYIYAVSFSGFYFAMLLALLALILRPVGFEYRSKIKNETWRKFWDGCLFVSAFVPSIVFGVAIGNVLQGVPFSFNDYMMLENRIEFFSLFSPFALLCGFTSLAMLVVHGACYLAVKTDGKIFLRSRRVMLIAPFAVIILFALGGVFLAKIPCYELISFAGVNAVSDPMNKQVVAGIGCWFSNYEKFPWIVVAPILGFLGEILTVFFAAIKHPGKAFISSAVAIAGIIATVGLTMFPFIIPSSLNPNASLLVFDASSSHWTLMVMLFAVVIFIPIIIAYTSFVHYVMRGKVVIDKNKNSSY